MSVLSSETSLRTPAWTSAGRGFHSFLPVPVHQSPWAQSSRRGPGRWEVLGPRWGSPSQKDGKGFQSLAGWVTFSISLFLSPL